MSHTYQRGDRVRLKDTAPGSDCCLGAHFEGIVSEQWADHDPAEYGAGPLYLVFVGRHMGVMGTGYTLNTADELDPGWEDN